MKIRIKQLIAVLIFSIAASILSIIHGVFFDSDFSQIKRLTLTGFFSTFILVYLGLILLEWIFDLNNQQEMIKINRKINKINKK